VARGALVAAKELGSALALALPPDVPPAAWFGGVTRAADEVAAGLPIVLAGEVALLGEGATDVERARDDAWRLLDAGLTHLAVDVSAAAPAQRGRLFADVAQPAAERGASVEVVVPLRDGAQAGTRAADVVEEGAGRGVTVDVASARCPAPADDDEARLQAAVLARISKALSGVPVMRRGPPTPGLMELLRGSPVVACEDGGVAAARALAVIGAVEAGEGAPARTSPLERAAAGLSPEDADRLEARAYVEVVDLVERLGAPGSAHAVARALERRLEER
jgi:hypothetical protein